MDKKSILIFGAGPLQKSLIHRCKLKGLFTVGIDPMEDASCKNDVDVFEVVDGQDFEKTLEVAIRYHVKGIITAATDKPLVMMARVGEKLNLPFFSVETAQNSTDKLLMKRKLMEASLPCAKGYIISNAIQLTELEMNFPVIVKPRDNSGSRGVIYCKNIESAANALEESLKYTKIGNVLVEEFIEGQEYSIEGIHYNGEHHVIQFTEKKTTDFPYNVELGHIQPANISLQQQSEIEGLIAQIGKIMGFENCASHTEIKINSKGVFIIETSPRLGGDFISSALVPLSTGINMEDILISVATNTLIEPTSLNKQFDKSACVKYFQISEGEILSLDAFDELNELSAIINWSLSLKVGEKVERITSSIDRYGFVIFQTENRSSTEIYNQKIDLLISKIKVKNGST